MWDAFSSWCDKHIGWVMTIIAVLVFAAVVGLLWWATEEEAKKPHFTLVKDQWHCTESHSQTYTSFIMVGKVMVPQVHTRQVCDQYNRR